MFFLIYLDIIAPLVPLPFLLLKKDRRQWENIVLFYLLLQLVLNSIAKYMMLGNLNNIYVYVANSFFSFLTVGFFFLQVFKNAASKKTRVFSGIFFLITLLILSLIIVLEDISFFNSLSFSFTAFSICLFCLLYYLINLSNPKEESIIRTGLFWMITGFFIYYGGNFFIFLTYKIFTKMDPSKFKIVWGLHNTIFFIFCCISLIAVKWKKLKT